MTYNTNHLTALHARLVNETARHGGNSDMAVYLDGIRREIKSEEEFLAKHGVETYASDDDSSMTIDDILAELEL